MIDSYDREQVVKLLRRAGDPIAQSLSSPQIHTNLDQLTDHLKQEGAQ